MNVPGRSGSGLWVGAYPYLWLDARIERVRDREARTVRHKALLVAYAVHESGPAGGDRHQCRGSFPPPPVSTPIDCGRWVPRMQMAARA